MLVVVENEIQYNIINEPSSFSCNSSLLAIEFIRARFGASMVCTSLGSSFGSGVSNNLHTEFGITVGERHTNDKGITSPR